MLRRTLTYEGFRVVAAADGREALAWIEAERPDAMVLDWPMPELDGIEVTTRLRDVGDETPILMLTAHDAIEDRVEGLDSGADDYLVKPFAPAELVARIHALLRRSAAAEKEKPLSYADLFLDPVTRETRRGDRAFTPSPTEFDLLHYLMLNPRHVLPRHRILDQVWGYDFGGDDNVLEVYVGYLCKKTEAGGDLLASGQKRPHRPWRIGVQSPRKAQSRLLASFSVENQAVATSGDYLQSFTADLSQHRILDPRTGRSSPELASATVMAPTAALADGVATAAMVLGPQASLKLVKSLPGCEAYLVSKKLESRKLCSAGWTVGGR